MPDTPANQWSFLTSLTPTLNMIASALVGLLLGAGGVVGYQAANPIVQKPVIAAADPPKPQPEIAALQESARALGVRLEAMEKKLDELVARPAPVAPKPAARKAAPARQGWLK